MTADRSSQPDQPAVTPPGDIPMPALGFGTFELEEPVAREGGPYRGAPKGRQEPRNGLPFSAVC